VPGLNPGLRLLAPRASRGVVRLAKALVLTLALGVIVLGYRFLVFLITLFATT
jgi:hypothetical protein